MHIGLVGCGRWGQLILQTLTKLSIPVSVCDLDTEHCRQALALGALTATPTIEPLYFVNGLIVATPASTHRAVLEQVASLGKPIFVEKPLATSYENAITIERLALPPTFLMHIWRYHPGVQMLGDIGRSGRLGQIVFLRTHRTNWTSPRTDTDSLRTLAPHILANILNYRSIYQLYIIRTQLGLDHAHGKRFRNWCMVSGSDPLR